jgi:hypothetical protein
MALSSSDSLPAHGTARRQADETHPAVTSLSHDRHHSNRGCLLNVMKNKHRCWKLSDRIFQSPVKKNFRVSDPHWAKQMPWQQPPPPGKERSKDVTTR